MFFRRIDMFIRTATEEDANQLIDIYKPYIENSTTSFEYDVPSLDDFKQRISDITIKYPYIIMVDGAKILGYAYAHEYKDRDAYQWTVEVSVYLSKNAQGRGIGSKLYNYLEEYLCRQHVVNIMACITGDNKTSIAFHEHMGYKTVGQFKKVGFKNNQWLDIYWLEKQISSSVSPEAFIPFSKLNELD